MVIDVETKKVVEEVGGWKNADKLGVSVVCAYDSKINKILSYTEKNINEFISLCKHRLVIGYNIRGFDLKVLTPYGLDAKKLDIFDIMYDIETLTRQRFIKLESIAQGTLKVGKSADGLKAVNWWKEGNISKIIEYCKQDVKITRDIFEYGRQNGIIKIQLSDKVKEVPVEWN